MLDDIAEVIGVEAAFALAWEFRGQRPYVPKDPGCELRIAAAIGTDRAERFCDVFGGTILPIPFTVVIEQRVRAMADGTRTKREIARLCCIREARVYAILARQQDSQHRDRQLKMF